MRWVPSQTGEHILRLTMVPRKPEENRSEPPWLNSKQIFCCREWDRMV